MAITPSITPEAFNVVQVNGVDMYGTTITRYGTRREKATFEDEACGLLAAHVTPPTTIKENPEIVWGGRLSDLADGPLIGMCLDADGTLAWNAVNTVVEQTILYGPGAGNGTGFQTTGCFGERLVIRATPNRMIEFTANLRGKQTTKVTPVIDTTPATVGWYPFEKATFSIGVAFGTYVGKAKTCLGLTVTLTTGYFPVWCPDGNQYYADVGERKTKQMIIDLILGDNAVSDAEYDKYVADDPTSIKFLMTSTGDVPATCTVEAYGSYVDWDCAGQDGLQTHRARFASGYDGTGMQSYKISST